MIITGLGMRLLFALHKTSRVAQPADAAQDADTNTTPAARLLQHFASISIRIYKL